MKKIKIEDILKKKQIIEDLKKPYYCKFFDCEIEITDVNPQKVSDIITDEEADQYYKYLRMIRTCCPFFQSKELNEEFECKDPNLIVDRVFGSNLKEIYALGNYIARRYGFGEEQVKELKK